MPGGLFASRGFSRLSRAEQSEVLRRWERSTFFAKRMVAQGLRQSARFAFFSEDANWSLLGYEGPWVARER